MLEPDVSANEDVYGVRHLESELRDGDSAFREIVRILMDEDNPPDDDRGPRLLSQQSYSHDEGWRSREYGQLIRDAIFCLSFLAVLLSVLILIILRSNKLNRHPSISTQGKCYRRIIFKTRLIFFYTYAFQKVLFHPC